MIHIEEPPRWTCHAVLADDGVVETLRLGRIPAKARARWSRCWPAGGTPAATGTQQAALT